MANKVPEKLPSVWELLDERDKLRKEILELKKTIKRSKRKARNGVFVANDSKRFAVRRKLLS